MSEEMNNQYSFENPEYRKTYWHTCSHVLAQAVKRLYPEVKLAIGPSIEEAKGIVTNEEWVAGCLEMNKVFVDLHTQEYDEEFEPVSLDFTPEEE